jgi:MFS family permease
VIAFTAFPGEDDAVALVMATADGASALYTGRLITGIGGAVFNVILTKMVTDWFVQHEFVTALAIMLTAWPVGISLGLLTQGDLADAYGWPWAMHATGILAFVALILTATLYREPPGLARVPDQPLRFGLPPRQLVHISIVGVGWTLSR